MSMRSRSPLSGAPDRQRGIVLFIALVVMVAMSLAAIALIRAVDTTNSVVGNLGFRQASILPSNQAIEEAAAALFSDAAPVAATITDKDNNLLAQNYFASRQPGEDARGIPQQLQRRSNFTLPRVLSDGAGNEMRYIIERMCLASGAAVPGNCDMMPPKQGSGTTIGDESQPTLPRQPFYRVTVRVDGPKNTTSFVQAILR